MSGRAAHVRGAAFRPARSRHQDPTQGVPTWR
jgi:hypothetical protein